MKIPFSKNFEIENCDWESKNIFRRAWEPFVPITSFKHSPLDKGGKGEKNDKRQEEIQKDYIHFVVLSR